MDCVIIASGNFEATPEIKKRIKTCPLIICADGGARHLREQNLYPHVLIGDFDSIHPDDKAVFIKNNVQVVEFPPKKDQTDTELCITWALDHQATDITLLGVTGSRMDHTLANIFLLRKLIKQNITARIIDSKNEMIMVMDTITMEGNPGDLVSIIPITQIVSGITLMGLEYEMTDGQIEMGSSLGISNCFIKSKAVVSIKGGMALVIKSRD